MGRRRSQAEARRQKRAGEQQQWEEEAKQLAGFRAKAPHIKKILRGRGCVLPFYDYLDSDSYSNEFQCIATAAKKEHPSLIGIREVDGQVFDTPEEYWVELGCGGLRQVLFKIKEHSADYGTRSPDANLCGSTSAFVDSDESVRSIILIRQSVKGAVQHRELRYALKLASLLHEIGHVQDLEQGLNFDVPREQLDVIGAEVFAHLFALEQMEKRNLLVSYNMLVDALRDAVPMGGYRGRVAREVLTRLPAHQIVDWRSVFSRPPTPWELKELGPRGIESLKR